MKSVQIALKDWKIRLKDRKSFLLMIFMPVLLTIILGASLSGVFNSQGSSAIPEVRVAVFVEDEDPSAIAFITNVLEGGHLKDILTITKGSSIEEVNTKVREDIVDVGLVIHENMSENLNDESRDVISLIVDRNKQLKSDIVNSIVTTYVERMKTVYTTVAYVLEKEAIAASTNEAMKVDVPLLVEDLKEIAATEEQVIEVRQVGDSSISSKQYYAAAMLAMFLLYNVSLGAKSFLQERTTDTFARILSTPTSVHTLVFGKFLGTLAFSFTQFILFYISTKYLFSINWGDNVIQLIMIGLAYSVTVSGLACVLAALSTDMKVIDVTSGIVIQVMALLGGSMLPIYAFPDVLISLAKYSPNHWALTGLISVMQGVTWSELQFTLLLLILIGTGAYFIGMLKFSRLEGGVR